MVYVKSLLRRADNFMYIVKRTSDAKKALVVDLVNEENYEELAKNEGIEISAVLTTHHHYDHCGGNEGFRREFPKIPILGGDERVPAMSRHVEHLESTAEFADLKIVCLSTPCHTSGHICYHITDPSDSSNPGVVFTGDTLFVAGCGRFFEGTAPQMHHALNSVLAGLPDETFVYPGHEYTASNLKFAAHIEPENAEIRKKLEWALEQGKQKKFTIPSTIGEEKRINPFMRVTVSDEIQKTVETKDPVKGMAKLREMKNEF